MTNPIHSYRWLAALLLSAISFSPNAAAQDAGWDQAHEAAQFETCYASHPPAERYETCNYMQRCASQLTDASTIADLEACALQAVELWDAKLASEHAELSEIISVLYGEDALAATQDAQRAWGGFRDKECYAISISSTATGYGGGGAIHYGCLAKLSAQRAAELAVPVKNLRPRYRDLLNEMADE